MQITATYINLYHVCRRELWLHAKGIRMEHTSDTVYEGKLIGETSYGERAEKNKQLEINLPLDADCNVSVKIDFYDPKTRTVYETKKSDRMEQAHIAQVKFYLYVLQKSGVPDPCGIIEYPKLRDRTRVSLADDDLAEIESWIAAIQKILRSSHCPELLHKPICKNCSYYDYCYADEL